MKGSANLNLMIRAARTAGRSLARDFREVENLQASMKGTADFSERAASAADGVVRSVLMDARPNYGWLGRGKEKAGKDPTRRWIVDPLNGYSNFLHGLPHWAVSIALEHKGEIVAAVVFGSPQQEVFATELGAGAFVNENRLRVSARKATSDAVFAAGVRDGLESRKLSAMLADISRLAPACAGIRQSGAPALDLAYVAAGRYEGYWGRGLGAADVAAGILLLRHSGGMIEALSRGGDPLAGGVVAANEPIFDRFAEIIRAEGKPRPRTGARGADHGAAPPPETVGEEAESGPTGKGGREKT